MKTKKVSFFKRIKDAVINFDEYLNFLEEKLSVAIKYIIKLALILTFIITIALTVKIVQEANNLIISFQNEAPEFSFQNNELVIEGENQKILKGDESGYFGLIVDTQNESLSNVEETADYQRVIGVLKDKIVVRDVEGVEVSIFVRQTEKGCKVSLRSNEYVNVSDVCLMFGGGGHQRAAGALMQGDIDQVKERILYQVRGQLK